MADNNDALVALVADIVSAYVSNNSVPTADLPNLIATIHAAITGLGAEPAALAAEGKPTPAVTVKKSITADYIVCLDDGKKFKSLKRHLRSAHGMSPKEYRARWGLPVDYPMVAPSYAEARSSLATKMGLGQQRRRSGGKAVK